MNQQVGRPRELKTTGASGGRKGSAGLRLVTGLPGSSSRAEAPALAGLPRAHAATVESNLALAAHIASRYRNSRMPTEDLFHEGVIGLIRAARYFDPLRGKPFASYAGFWIRKYIRDALFREFSFLHVPSHRRVTIRRIVMRHEADGKSKDSLANLAEMTRNRHLDVWSGCSTLNPEEALLHKERVRIVQDALRRLSSIEQVVVAQRFGLGSDNPQTLAKIGTVRGMTRQRVHQIEQMAKRRLRRRFESLGWTIEPPTLASSR